MKSYQRFFAELKRRHVFRVMAVYGVVGFVLLQVVDLVVPALLLPAWTYRLVALLLLVAFPIALVITWAFEITQEGIRKTEAAPPGEIEAIVAQPASKRWPAGLLALVGMAALVVGAWWVGRQTAPGADGAAEAEAGSGEMRLAMADADGVPRPSIAVLPFADMSPDHDQEYFSDGISEELLNVLAKIRDLQVEARTSAFAFKDSELTAEQLGDTLRVQYLVEGSVRKAGDQLRITAQLIDTEDGAHLWSEQYDRELNDVFAIQTEIAEAIADELRVSLGLDRGELVTPTADLEAYDLYLAGRARLRERGESLREAVRLFEAAIVRDSSWAPAWAGLAEAHELRTYYPAGWDEPPTDTESRLLAAGKHQVAAERAAKRALRLDADIASAWTALGSVHRNRRQWATAEREYLRALELDPDNAEAHQQYSDMLVGMGRIAEGIAAAERAVRLDPAPIRFLNLADAQWADGRRGAALESMQKGIAWDPANRVPFLPDAWYLLNLALERYDEAPRFGLPSGEARLTVTPSQHASLVEAMRAGDPSLFPSELAEQWMLVLVTWRSLGEPGRALTAMEEILVEHSYDNLSWLWIPQLDPIRDEPRYRSVLEEINLEGATPKRTPPDRG